jgi:hypothetical protein
MGSKPTPTTARCPAGGWRSSVSSPTTLRAPVTTNPPTGPPSADRREGARKCLVVLVPGDAAPRTERAARVLGVLRSLVVDRGVGRPPRDTRRIWVDRSDTGQAVRVPFRASPDQPRPPPTSPPIRSKLLGSDCSLGSDWRHSRRSTPGTISRWQHMRPASRSSGRFSRDSLHWPTRWVRRKCEAARPASSTMARRVPSCSCSLTTTSRVPDSGTTASPLPTTPMRRSGSQRSSRPVPSTA